MPFAEEGGFEPPVQLPVRQFSKLLVSATHPPFLSLASRLSTIRDRVAHMNFRLVLRSPLKLKFSGAPFGASRWLFVAKIEKRVQRYYKKLIYANIFVIFFVYTAKKL